MFNSGIIADTLCSFFLSWATSIPYVQDSVGHTVQQLNAIALINSTLLEQKLSSGIIEPGKYISASAILVPKDIINVPQQPFEIFSDAQVDILLFSHGIVMKRTLVQ
ncbi:unnamed protein product [Umbelopsis ramanniana]